MMSSFLSLLKEEPTEGTDMETNNNGRLTLPRPLAHQNSIVNDPQIQGLTISPLAPNAMQPPGMIRGDIDPNFEPVTRGRSNTWPLLPEGFMESDDSSVADPTTSGDAQRLQGGTSLLEGPGGPPKKNTSRRNPWGNMSYADLIAQAIVSSPEGRATLSQIYDWMVQNVPYFKDKGDSNSSAGWKNSIRHNLSLHNRFMRMQNEGTGKSSWWVLNPDAKPGKSTRRRANTLEGNRMEKKRGRVRKKEGLRNSIEAPSSPSMGEGLEFYPGSPSAASLHHPFQLSPQDYRPRASSNASSCGRLSPIPSLEADMHDAQVPPVSPLAGGWGSDYWSATNHGIRPHMGGHVHEQYTEHLAESIGEGLKLGSREPWGPHLHGMAAHSGSAECLKVPHPHHHHHMNGFISQSLGPHPPSGYGSYEDYNNFMNPNSQCGGSFPQNPLATHTPHNPKDKLNIRRPPIRNFHAPPLQQSSSHNVSPTVGEARYSSVEQEMRLNPSYSTPSTNNTPPTSHLSPPSSQQTLTTSNTQDSGKATTTTITTTASSMPTHNHPQTSQQHQSPESTTMLRVALSHRDTSSYSINGVPHYRQNGVGQPYSLHTPSGPSDFVDLDNIQGGLECNVDEVIKHELQYEDNLTFDFHQQQASAYSHSHPYPHRESGGPQMGGPSGPVQVYSYNSIPNGNQWVR